MVLSCPVEKDKASTFPTQSFPILEAKNSLFSHLIKHIFTLSSFLPITSSHPLPHSLTHTTLAHPS